MLLLDHDIREDDVESIVAAIEMIKCVQEVKLGAVVNLEMWRAADEFRRSHFELLFAILKSASFGQDEADVQFLSSIRAAHEIYKETK